MGAGKVLIVATAALAVGGYATSASTGGPSGSVHGSNVLSGGPRQASPAGAPGTVVVPGGGDEVARQRIEEGQEFQFAMSAGNCRPSVKAVDGACLNFNINTYHLAERANDVLSGQLGEAACLDYGA